MKYFQFKDYFLFTLLLLTFLSCKTKEVSNSVDNRSWFSTNGELSKHYDKESNTTYYLTRIKHKDSNGKLIKLRMGVSNRIEGETVPDFAKRVNSEVAINASMGLGSLPTDVRQPVGIQIIDGSIKQKLSTKSYTLGIKDDNELVAHQPGVSASEMLEVGSNIALTAFVPLILDHKFAPEEIFKVAGNLMVKHPRQVVAQYDNKDILFLSTGGRGYDGDGMTARDLMRILKSLDVRFAFNLDGGGSVSTVIKDRLITKKIDERGTKDRLRPNFLYVIKN